MAAQPRKRTILIIQSHRRSCGFAEHHREVDPHISAGFPGGTNPNAKLTAEQVKDIRQSSSPQIALAKQFGVTAATICEIKKGLEWKSV